MKTTLTRLLLLVVGLLPATGTMRADDLERIFDHPPAAAKPRVMWMWMGCHISRSGITRDLEALQQAGFGGTMMFSLSDVPTTWSADIGKSPTPEIIAWTEPWWKLVRHAAKESKRLGMDFGMGNCPGYGTSGGPWIKPELSMQEICWSQTAVSGPRSISMEIARPRVDPRAILLWPIFNSDLGKEEKPVIPARNTFYRDIAVLALPAAGTVDLTRIIDLSEKVGPDGRLTWEAPDGQWIIYRIGHTTMGAMQFPAQWKANGLECDKMNPQAVEFHVKHIIGEIEKYLGDLVGTAFTHIHFDSYESPVPTWTPKMREEFLKRRGYDLTSFLPTFAGRKVESDEKTARFKTDFEHTVHDLYRDAYFATISRLSRQAGLDFMSEPYGGPWKIAEVVPLVHRVAAEFWSDSGRYRPYKTGETIAAARRCGRNIVEAEAFSSMPEHSLWSEYPGMLKAVSDVAFCEGINRFVVHRFVHQPWDEHYRPGFTMGQWGTHFDRTQTWWEPGKALVAYWQRCQALLQWGKYVGDPDAFKIVPAGGEKSTAAQPKPRFIQRRDESADVFFVANTDTTAHGMVSCSFSVSGKQPELWDPVTGTRRDLPEFEQREGRTLIPLKFAPTQSWFVVFRKPDARTPSRSQSDTSKKNFPRSLEISEITGSWEVKFDPQWGGPAQPVTFDKLQDWTKRLEPGIRYYSGTAVYRTLFDVPSSSLRSSESRIFLDLGVVKHIARVRLNDHNLGVVWTAPWSVDISDAVREKDNSLEIEVTNVWVNRLIGDEQEPADCNWYPFLPAHRWCRGVPLKELPDWFLKGEPRPSTGRYCFTTWNYFTKDSPLVPSGLLGPVRIKVQPRAVTPGPVPGK